jgi:hypothetical protein
MVRQVVVKNGNVPMNPEVVRAVLEAHGIEVDDEVDVALSTPGTVIGRRRREGEPFEPFYIRLENHWTNIGGAPTWRVGSPNADAVEKMAREDADFRIISDASVEVFDK